MRRIYLDLLTRKFEDSVKPYGKKGPMLCTACAEKEEVA